MFPNQFPCSIRINTGPTCAPPINYLCPSLPVEHRPSTTPSPSHSVLGCSGHSGPVGPLLFQLCFSVSPPTVARPASLSLPLWVPGQGLACGAGCWLPEGVSDPAPLPPQYLLSHWFLSHSLPQIFIPGLLLPLDFWYPLWRTFNPCAALWHLLHVSLNGYPALHQSDTRPASVVRKQERPWSLWSSAGPDLYLTFPYQSEAFESVRSALTADDLASGLSENYDRSL